MKTALLLLLACLAVPAAQHALELPLQKASKCNPVALQQQSPKWPKKIKAAGYRGDPLVSFAINERGEVERVVLLKSSGSAEVDRAVIDAAKTWKFKAQPGCGVREVKMSVTIHFGPQGEN